MTDNWSWKFCILRTS